MASPECRYLELVLSGDSGAGKTSILHMFVDGKFNKLYTSTIGLEVRTEVLQIEEQGVVVQIWDTSGQKKFMSDVSACYRTAKGIMLVYNTSDRDSFCAIGQWKQEVDKCAKHDVPLVLVGNKCDLVERRVVSHEEGERMAASMGAAFLEVSAKTGENVTEAFAAAVKLALNSSSTKQVRIHTQDVKDRNKESDVTVQEEEFSKSTETKDRETSKYVRTSNVTLSRQPAIDIPLKLALLGDNVVGKTSIVHRICENKFLPSTLATLGVENGCKAIEISGRKVRLHIWGIPGSHYLMDLSIFYLRGTHGVMLIYRVGDRMSFFNIPLWKQVTRPGIPLVLVGHVFHQCPREVSQEEGQELAATIGAQYFEVCAKRNINITEVFTALARVVLYPQGMAMRGRMELAWCTYHVTEVKAQNVEMVSSIKKIPRDIKTFSTREKEAKERARRHNRRATALQQQIEKDYGRVQNAVEELAHARHREHAMERELRRQQDHMAATVQTVQLVERMVTDLEQQLARRDRREGDPALGCQQLWVVEREEVELTEEVLGKGSWATIYVARFRGLPVAAKCLRDLNISDYNQQIFSREMTIAATVRHPNLLQFIGATTQGQPIIISELMSTSLRAELERQPLLPQQISSISLDVARALLYLHLMQPDPIIHRDISSANVLLNPGSSDHWLAKVSDYGSANYLQQVTTCSTGNPSYAAPEANIPTQQTTKMDVYSYGVLLLEMWSRTFPEKAKHKALVQSLERDDVREVVETCLRPDQLLRPTMKDIVEELQ